MDYETRKAQAEGTYRQGLERVKNNNAPKNQKFPCGSRVYVTDDLGSHMSHFPFGCEATVMYTYAHAYGGDKVKSYCLDIDNQGNVCWYEEWQLTLSKNSYLSLTGIKVLNPKIYNELLPEALKGIGMYLLTHKIKSILIRGQ